MQNWSSSLLALVTLLSVLTTYVYAAPTDVPSAASFYVPSLPDIHQDPNHPLTIFAGHLSSDPKASKALATDVTSHLYFVLLKRRRNADKERVMFWFNGGPGCSSFDGLMMEVGPWRLDKDGKGFTVAEGGWEEYTTMVYVDQPAGTGFSYTSTNAYVHTIYEASEQFMEFLRNFYQVFPEYKHVDTYLGGESYAGQYIPYFANAILDSNAGIPLQGVAIGNGWIDAKRQYPAYIEYAVKMEILKETSDEFKDAMKLHTECLEIIKENYADSDPPSIEKCEDLLGAVSAGKRETVNGQEMCLNIYDVRLQDTSPQCGMNWPVDIGPITQYLDRKDVVHALHADSHSEAWVECRGSIHRAVDEKKFNSSVSVLPRVLERIPVLLFAGDQDLICNHMGQEALIAALEWNGEVGLGTVQTQSWSVNDVPAGTWVSSRNLTYAKIFNASHMVPYDLPHVAHDMILRFMGMNFSSILDGSARIPSNIGDMPKPLFNEGTANEATPSSGNGKTPEQETAMWEAYYNAGSALLVLVILGAIVGVYFFIRRRRNQHAGVQLREEEEIPLRDERSSLRKGKERAHEEEEPIFDVGESSEDEVSDTDSRR